MSHADSANYFYHLRAANPSEVSKLEQVLKVLMYIGDSGEVLVMAYEPCKGADPQRAAMAAYRAGLNAQPVREIAPREIGSSAEAMEVAKEVRTEILRNSGCTPGAANAETQRERELKNTLENALHHLRSVYSQIGNHSPAERRHSVTPGVRDGIRDFLEAHGFNPEGK